MDRYEVKLVNHLSNNFWVCPEVTTMIMSNKEYRETLKATEGYIIACGKLYSVMSKSLGAGMRRVYLKKGMDNNGR